MKWLKGSMTRTIWPHPDFTTLGMALKGDADSLRIVLEKCPYRGPRSRAISHLGDCSNEKVVPSLLLALKSRDTELKAVIIEELARRKCREAAPRVLKIMKTCRSESLFNTAVEALASLGAAEAVKPLAGFIRHPRRFRPHRSSFGRGVKKEGEKRTRHRIEDSLGRYVSLLGHFGGPAVEELIRFFHSSVESIRSAAGCSLNDIVNARTRRFWIKYLETCSVDERYLGIEALTRHDHPSVAVLMERASLEEPKIKDRIEALKYLASRGHRDARQEILAYLDSSDRKARAEAVDACGDLKFIESIPPLRTILLSPHDDEQVNYMTPIYIKDHAEDALTKLGAPAVPALLESLNEEYSALLQVDCILNRIKMMPTDGLFEVLAESLANPNKLIRLASLRALIYLRDRRSIEILRKCLSDSEADIRGEALRGLGFLKALACLSDVADFLQDSSAYLRTLAIEALGEMDARILAAEIASKLADPDPGVVRAAIGSLGRLRAVQYEKEIKAILSSPERIVAETHHGDDSERMNSPLKKIVEKKTEFVTKPLARMLETSEESLHEASTLKIDAEDIMWACLYALKDMGGELPLDMLLRLIADRETPFYTRDGLISLIGDLGDERAIPYLVQIIKDPISWDEEFCLGDLKRTAYPALLDCRYPNGLEAFISLLDDDHTEVVAAALTKLPEYKDEKAVLAISANMRRFDFLLRSIAVWAIGQIGGRTAAEILKNYETDRSAFVRALARSARERIETRLMN